MIEFKCHRCGKVDERITRGLNYCADCAVKQAVVRKAYYESCKALKICVRCGKKDEHTLSGHIECFGCALRSAKQQHERYHKKKTARSCSSETVDEN